MKSPDVCIDTIAGNCPVQGEGQVNGYEFYFRARGTHWSLTVYDGSEQGWYHSEEYADGEEFAAGWMDEDEARKCIEKGAALFADKSANPDAAQELLEALKEMIPAYDDARSQYQGHELLAKARAAVAKAESK